MNTTEHMIEHCPECDAETEHAVTVEIVQESETGYSNEPYRIAECQRCGHEDRTRMNNAGTIRA